MKNSQPLRALRELSQIIVLGASVDDVFTTALKQMVTFMEAHVGTIQLLDHENALHTVAVYGDISRDLHAAINAFTLDDAGLQFIMDSDYAHIVPDPADALAMAKPLATLLRQEPVDTAVIIALKVEGRSIGTLSVAYHAPYVVPRDRLAWFETMTSLIGVGLHNTQLLEDLHAKQVALQDAWKAVTDAQEMERKRLSRELHDDVGQALTSLMLRLKTLQAETDLETISDRLNGLRYLTGQTLEEVRRISADLRPVVFDELGLIPAIRSYVNERSAWSKIDITFRTTGDVYPLRPELEIACYRTIQEGLTNIIRHAHASQAVVELAYGSETVQLTISDDGIGMHYPPKAAGVGLLGMQERVRLIGGEVSIVSEPGAGLTLIITFPISA